MFLIFFIGKKNRENLPFKDFIFRSIGGLKMTFWLIWPFYRRNDRKKNIHQKQMLENIPELHLNASMLCWEDQGLVLQYVTVSRFDVNYKNNGFSSFG